MFACSSVYFCLFVFLFVCLFYLRLLICSSFCKYVSIVKYVNKFVCGLCWFVYFVYLFVGSSVSSSVRLSVC